MRTEDFHKLLDDPRQIEGQMVDDLKLLATKYPYSQIVQLLYGLRLRTSSEHLFNQQLGKTAALTNDRAVLFEIFENKPRLINSGVDTVEVDQELPPPELPRVEDTEAKKSIDKGLELETEASGAEDSVIGEEVTEKKEDHESHQEAELPASEVQSLETESKEREIPEEKAPQEPREKVELPSATPENLEGLSPQEKVQAILRRNRELRAKFDSRNEEVPNEPATSDLSTRDDSTEQLINTSSPEHEESTGDKDNIQQPETSASDFEDLRKADSPEMASSESADAELSELGKEEEPSSPETDSDQQLSSEGELHSPGEADEAGEAEEAGEADKKDEASEASKVDFSGAEEASSGGDVKADDGLEAEEEKEPWADSPIDIEALIRRRFAKRYEAPIEEEDPWATEDEVQAEVEGLPEETIPVEEEESSADLENREPEGEESTQAQEEDKEQAELPKSDLALAARIRMIRDRLESLKGDDAISREELAGLMEEHRQLEALMADLPLDEEQLFEVDITGATEGEHPDSEEEQLSPAEGSDLEPSTEGSVEEQPKEQAESDEPIEESDDEQKSTSSDTDSAPVAAEKDGSEAENEGADDQESSQPEESAVGLEPEDLEDEAKEEETAVAANTELPSDARDSMGEDENDSSVVQLQLDKAEGGSEDEPRSSDEASKEEAPAMDEEEDLDAEIARIEALAAQLRSGRNREMSQDDINSMREARMNEMIEERKRHLEESSSDESEGDDLLGNELESKDQELDSSLDPVDQEKTDELIPESQETKGSSESADHEEENLKPSATASEESEGVQEASTIPEAQIEDRESENASEEMGSDPNEEESPSDGTDSSSPPKQEQEAESKEEGMGQSSVEAKAETEEEDVDTGSEISASDHQAHSPSETEGTAPEASEPEAEEEEGERPSFSDWLKQISGSAEKEDSTPDAAKAATAADSEAELEAGEKEDPKQEISKKIDLLDSFVEKLPDLKKQSRESKAKASVPASEFEEEENQGSGLVTETLAKVYIRQKHFKKAIQAYEILMLKYPEKSSFFASRISEIKKLANSK